MMINQADLDAHPKYNIPDQHLDVIIQSLRKQPHEVVDATIQLLVAQANTPENIAKRPKVVPKQPEVTPTAPNRATRRSRKK